MAGSISKRGDTYHIRYDLRPVNGKRKQRSEACKGMNKRQAESLLQQRIVEVREGRLVADTHLTVGDLFTRVMGFSRNLSPVTTEKYASIGHCHILPRWGNVRADKLQPADVQTWYSTLRNAKTGKPLNPKTIRNIHGLFDRILGEAVRLNLLQHNPLDRVRAPKDNRSREIRTATPMQLKTLREGLEQSELRLPFLLILSTGMRRGEVCGLKWEDVDFDRCQLTVRRTAIRALGGVVVKSPKNSQARVISLPEAFVRELRGYRLTSDSEWVYPGPGGGVHNPNRLGEMWVTATAKLGIDIRLHELRHTHATELIMAGVPAKVVSERLGHASVEITLDLYTHVLQHMQERAGQVVGELFFGEEKR